MIVPGLDPSRTVLVIRGASRELRAGQIAELLGLPTLAELPHDPAGSHPDGLRLRRLRRRTRQAAEVVLQAARDRLDRPLPPTGVDDAA